MCRVDAVESRKLVQRVLHADMVRRDHRFRRIKKRLKMDQGVSTDEAAGNDVEAVQVGASMSLVVLRVPELFPALKEAVAQRAAAGSALEGGGVCAARGARGAANGALLRQT